jgi:hypothetical protein
MVIVPAEIFSVPAETFPEVMPVNVIEPVDVFWRLPVTETPPVVMLGNVMEPVDVFCKLPPIDTRPSAVKAKLMIDRPWLLTVPLTETVEPAPAPPPKIMSAPAAVLLLVIEPETTSDPTPPRISPPAAPEVVIDEATNLPVEAALKLISPFVVPLVLLDVLVTVPALRPVEFDHVPVNWIRPLPVLVPPVAGAGQLALFDTEVVVNVFVGVVPRYAKLIKPFPVAVTVEVESLIVTAPVLLFEIGPRLTSLSVAPKVIT